MFAVEEIFAYQSLLINPLLINLCLSMISNAAQSG